MKTNHKSHWTMISTVGLAAPTAKDLDVSYVPDTTPLKMGTDHFVRMVHFISLGRDDDQSLWGEHPHIWDLMD